MRKAFLILVSILCTLPVHTMLCAPAGAQVVINEILADPARDWDGDGGYNFRNDEWIEIINLGDAAVDLSAYLLADGDDGPAFRYGFSGLLTPGEVLVVFGSDRADLLLGETARGGLDLQPGPHGAQGVIFVGHWRAKKGKQFVTLQPGDRALIAIDRWITAVQSSVHDRVPVVGAHLLSQRRGIDDVQV